MTLTNIIIMTLFFVIPSLFLVYVIAIDSFGKKETNENAERINYKSGGK